MKFIHTGDWHIGKIVNEHSMLENQRYFLDELVKVLKDEKVDALVIAGDLYDRSIPPANAVELLDKYVDKIINELKIPILAIAGNHDSAERLSYGSSIMKNSGYHMAGNLEEDIRCVTIGDTDFYLLPYFDPAIGRHIFKDENIKDHEDGIKKAIEIIKDKKDDTRNSVLVTHAYVTSASVDKSKPRKEIISELEIEESDSERPLTMGGTEFVSASIFEGFDYVALGHIHEPKKISTDNEKVRYAGSPLKYSISEKSHRNSITIVDLDGDKLEVKIKEIKAFKELRVLKGKLEELINPEFYEKEKIDDYIHFILTDDGELYEPMAKLKRIYTNPLSLSREYKREIESKEVKIDLQDINKSKIELFKDFYENVTSSALNEDSTNIVSKIIDKVEGER